MTLVRSVGGMSALIAVMLLLSTTAASLRFLARYKQNKAFGIDDYLVIPAWLFFVGICAPAIFGMVRGFIGYPIPTDPQVWEALQGPLLQVYWAAVMIAVFGNGFVRLSALFFFRRVFITTEPWDSFGIVTFIWIIIVILWMITLPLFQLFTCGANVYLVINIQAPDVCSVIPHLITFAVSSFLLDLSILVMPIPKIWRLNMRPVKKIAVSIVFLTAATGAAASCARMVTNMKILFQGAAAVDKDFLLANTELYYFLILELGLCLTAVNLPSLRYLFTGDTLESALRSIRSVISLRSTRSATSRKQYDSETDSHTNDLPLEGTTNSRRTKRDRQEVAMSEV